MQRQPRCKNNIAPELEHRRTCNEHNDIRGLRPSLSLLRFHAGLNVQAASHGSPHISCHTYAMFALICVFSPSLSLPPLRERIEAFSSASNKESCD